MLTFLFTQRARSYFHEKRNVNRKGSPPMESRPWLVYRCGPDKTKEVFCNLYEPHDNYRQVIPSSFLESKVVSSSCGWFLISKKYTHFNLWNSTASDDSHQSLIHLPTRPLNPTKTITGCFLTSPPGDPHCMVLLFVKGLRSVMCIRPGDADMQWIEIPCANLSSNSAEDSTSERLKGCVSCNGKIYAFTRNGDQLVTLNMDKANNILRIEPLGRMPKRKSMNTTGTFRIRVYNKLVECCRELLYVYVVLSGSKKNQYITEVSVFKLDFATMIWERANTLMGQAVFLNGLGASSCPASGSGIIEADSVYFTLRHDIGLFSFNVKDGCLSVYLPPTNFPSTCGSPKILVPHDVRLCHSTQEKQGEEIDEKEDNIISKIQSEITFSDLPLDSLMEISGCLNIYDYLNYRAACRDCRFIVPKLQRKQSFKRLKTYHSSSQPPIWLLLPTNDKTVLKFVDPILGTIFLINLPESLKGSIVRYSKNGWLLMCDQKSSLSFLNPFTKEIIRLADTAVHARSLTYSMSFSSLPTSSDCIIVGCGALPPNSMSELRVMVATMGEDKQWLHEYFEDDSPFWLSNTSPLFYKGSFYLLGVKGNLSTLKYEEEEIDLEEFFWDILVKPKAPCRSFQESFLVECDGQLMSIFVGPMGKWFQVFSLNFTTMCWEKVESLGNYVIYVSRSSCISKEARIVGTGNRIYLPRFWNDNIVYYSLETRALHFGDQETVENFYNTKEPLLATWIEPRFSK